MSGKGVLYRFYRRKIYQKVKWVRGTTRLLGFLRRLSSLDIEEIDVDRAETVYEKGDWDNLLILDACRYDLYEEVVGKSDKRLSEASSSLEYIRKTFSEGDFSDTVYVTSNPYFNREKFVSLTGRLPEEVFYEVYHTYSTDWNSEEGTVMPEPIVRDALNARKLFPEKRLIVHFMQPHYPFVSFETDYEVSGFDKNANRSNIKNPNMLKLGEAGKVSQSEVWEGYRSNLEFVMPHVNDLIAKLEGKTVVTSDHGNLVGENGLFGHDVERPLEKLREVPWDVYE